MWTWHGFVKGLEKTEALIIQADEDLSQKEKEGKNILHFMLHLIV
jgi:hypothetical protein